MEEQELIIGIDLGTTNSEVAVYQQTGKHEGRPHVILDAQGRKILPSCVGVAEDGSLLVGEEAQNQYAAYPDRTIRSIKRLMGQKETVTMAGQAYLPQEISAIILKRLKGIAEAHLGQPVHKAVITVPAYFSDAQRQATREAGEIAGLDVVRMINEPTAAALVYETGHQEGKRILVYDLGGGTFDVSVVRVEEGVVEVISSHGNNHLGGDDFDQKIVTHLVTHLQEKHGVAVDAMPKVMARLLRAAEKAKITLSDHPFALIEEAYLLEHKDKPVHLSLELSRAFYEEMITPFIEETLTAVHTALSGSGMTASEVDSVLLVGGTTRTPLVGRRLNEAFGKRPRSEVDPDLCVALGASIQAAAIQGSHVSAVLVDVTPYTFGIAAYGELNGQPYPEVFSPVIEKNTPIPVQKSDLFFTVYDNQDAVDIRIFQGENRDALYNTLIGEFTVEGLSRAPAHSPLVVGMELDLDGILSVTATEKNTGLAKRISISNALKKMDDTTLVQAQERISDLFEEAVGAPETAAVHHHEVVQARALVEKAERMLEKASEEDRDEIINLIENIMDALNNNERESLREPCEQLSEILFYLDT